MFEDNFKGCTGKVCTAEENSSEAIVLVAEPACIVRLVVTLCRTCVPGWIQVGPDHHAAASAGTASWSLDASGGGGGADSPTVRHSVPVYSLRGPLGTVARGPPPSIPRNRCHGRGRSAIGVLRFLPRSPGRSGRDHSARGRHV
jgi:hypothetical protein